MTDFDWKNPDYTAMLRERRRRIARIRRAPSLLPVLRELYKRNPQQWLYDWACTFDPRNAERDLPTTTPFAAMPFLDSWISFVLECWRCQAYGLTEKSRETGLSWLAVFFAIWMCTHYRGTTVGFGSNLADNVDMLGNPRSLLEKIRIALRHMPREFRGGWTEDAPGNKENQIVFPAMSSMIIGQAGNKIGRGDRTSLYFCDEAAHLEQPLLVDAALSGTTNCRQDISSVFGFATPFAEKVAGGKHPTFRASWRDDLRKDEKWHQRMVDQYGLEIVGQEFDADPFAGREGQLIDARSVKAAIDIHKRLNIPMTGKTRGGMDVATRGRDLSALAIRTGIVLRHCSAWRSDQVKPSVMKVLKIMRGHDAKHYFFDGIGVGGDVDEWNAELQPDGVIIRAERYQGSEGPLNLKRKFPGMEVTNENLFTMQAGRTNQAWWYLRYLFDNTLRLSEGRHVRKPR